MCNLFRKATVTHLSYKDWKEDKELLSLSLLSILETWNMSTYDNPTKSLPNSEAREYGKIKVAYFGLDNDIHNLSINHHLINSLIKNNNIENGLKSMYISLLAENYIINIRSIYDFTSYFPRLLMPIENVQKYSNRKKSDSLNTLIKYCETDKLNLLPDKLNKFLRDTKAELDNIREIRDSIIHRGKEPIVEINDNNIFFRIPSKSPYGQQNSLPDILDLGNENYPLFDYLKVLTLKLFQYLENLGNIMIDELYTKNNITNLKLTSLTGTCMPDFIKYLNN